MFRKIQIKLTIFYTIVVAIILVATNLSIYFLFVSYNNSQLTNETERMLATIESSEWLYEVEAEELELDEEDRLIEDREYERPKDEDEKESQDSEAEDSEKINNIKDPEDAEDAEDLEDPEDAEDAEDIEDTEDNQEDLSDDGLTEEEKKALEEIKEEENKEEEEDANDGARLGNGLQLVSLEIELPSSEDILVPEILNDFSFYYIYSLEGQLVRWKNDFQSLHNDIKVINETIELNGDIKVHKFISENNYHFLMQKNAIISEGYELGYFVVGRDVSIAYETIDNLGRIILLSLIIGILLSLLLGYLIAGRTIKPIKEAFLSKQKFLADASHELRTPISVVLLSTDALDQEIDKDDEFNKQIVEGIREEALNMKGLVEKLLHLARHDSASLKVDKETVVMSDLLENVINGYSYIAKEKNISLILNNFNKDRQIYGDKNLIHSVFSIIIDNAIKYSAEESEVILNVDELIKKKWLFRQQEYIKVDIIDNGKGIELRDLGSIFNRFYRIESSRTRQVGGHGLGLSIAKEIVANHDGFINVDSQVGQGSCFTVLLPKKNE